MNSIHSRTIVKQFYALLLSFSLALTPVAAADAERVFAQVSPSIVVIAEEYPNGELEDIGSGVVVGEGFVVTNCHVVGDADAVVIKQARDTQGAKNYAIEADVRARDEDNDVCLLFAGGLTGISAAQAVKLGAAEDLVIGEEVYAIGAPAGLDLSLSQGIVTQLRGIGIKGKAPIVQTDATIRGGSSGGGLFNEEGELVGITTLGTGEADNLNFAMPVEMVKDLIEADRHVAEKREAQAMCIESPQYQCVLLLARQTAKQIYDVDIRDSALIDIAGAQAKAGYFNDAKKTAQNIPTAKKLDEYGNTPIEVYIDDYSTDYASRLLRKIAIELAESGYFDDAKATAKQIDDAEYRAEVLGEIAIAQVQAGNFDGARTTAQQADDAEYLDGVLSEIAVAQAQMGNFSSAKETAKQITDAYNHARVLDSIAFEQIQEGYLEDVKIIIGDALDSARRVDDASLRAGALSEIAITQRRAGYSKGAKMTFDNALLSAQQVDTSYPRAEALREVAVAQAQAGYLSDAMITIDEIEYSIPRDKALIETAIVQARAGDFAGAMKIAQSIYDDEFKTAALIRIAEALAQQ